MKSMKNALNDIDRCVVEHMQSDVIRIKLYEVLSLLENQGNKTCPEICETLETYFLLVVKEFVLLVNV